jgi:hypothetical protein
MNPEHEQGEYQCTAAEIHDCDAFKTLPKNVPVII